MRFSKKQPVWRADWCPICRTYKDTRFTRLDTNPNTRYFSAALAVIAGLPLTPMM